MKNKKIFGIFTLAIAFFVLSFSSSYARRYLIPLNEQFQKADCVVSAILLDTHTVKIKNTAYQNNMEFTIFEFKVKKDIKSGNYGSLVAEIVYVTSQTQPEWLKGHKPERYAPEFDSNKEYILFLKETPSYYLFNFVQDFKESVEYSEEIVNKIIK